jgi:predicted dehydrogenase
MDTIIISLPNFLHLDSINVSLEAGLNVFVEKPMATSVEESKKIVNIVEKSGKTFMVGNCMRFTEAVEKMKRVVDDGRIGKLEIVTIESIQNGPFTHSVVPKPVSEWWFNPKTSGGGVLLDLGYHLIDLFRFFAGDPKVLFSYLDYKFNLPVEDGATVVLNSNSTRGIINVGWFEKTIFPRFNFRLILHGNADYLSSDELVPRNPYVHAVVEGTKNLLRKTTGRKIRPLSYTYYYEAYYKELRHFFNCISKDIEPSVTVYDGLKTIEVIEEAYRVCSKLFGMN